MKAVCLLSGGMDSAVASAIAREEGFEIIALSFDYGQRNRRELDSAACVAESLKVTRHRIVSVDLSWSGSALTDASAEIPAEVRPGIPSTYVPARNTVFISLGLACAEAEDADAIYCGINAVDYSGYPDCRPEYVRAFQKLISLATRKTVEGSRILLKTPLLNLSKADVVRRGRDLDVDFSLTWSCYRGGGKPCGACASCVLRRKGFQEAGVPDPLEEAAKK